MHHLCVPQARDDRHPYLCCNLSAKGWYTEGERGTYLLGVPYQDKERENTEIQYAKGNRSGGTEVKRKVYRREGVGGERGREAGNRTTGETEVERGKSGREKKKREREGRESEEERGEERGHGNRSGERAKRKKSKEWKGHKEE